MSRASKNWVRRVQQVESRSGVFQPEILVIAPHDDSHRGLKAELHRIAWMVEMMTPTEHEWTVRIEIDPDERERGGLRCRGRVLLELAVGDAAEAEVGMGLLRASLRTLEEHQW